MFDLSTRYGPESASVAGGYSDTKLNANTYEMRFQVNSFTSAEILGALLLRRAAELTLEAERRHFLISDRRSLTRGEDPALLATVKILDEPTPDAADELIATRPLHPVPPIPAPLLMHRR